MVDIAGPLQDYVTLVVGGGLFEGWTSVEITREINAAAGSFTLKITEQPHLGGTLIPSLLDAAQPDEFCQILVNGQLALAGNIDKRHRKQTDESDEITVTGRSDGRRCVDCSHIDPDKAAQYNGQKPTQIVKKVTDALGVKLETRVKEEQPIEWFRYDPGGSALQVMNNAALKQGLTIGHRKDGTVLLADTWPESAPQSLIQGQNLKEWEVTKSANERHSKYKGRGQKAPNAKYRGKQANQMAAEAEDDGLKTYRPKLVVGLGDVDRNELEMRVKHEAARRAGLAIEVGAVVVGWTVNGGALWEPGQNAFVEIYDEQISELLLIKKVKMTKSEKEGTITEMSLTRRSAFEKGEAAKGNNGLGFPKISGKVEGL